MLGQVEDARCARAACGGSARSFAPRTNAGHRYAAACNYADIDDALLQRVDGVAAVLYRLAHRRR